MLKLVSNNDHSALDRRDAFADLRWNARATIPNLLAVMRGAGDTKELLQQILEFADSIEAAAKLSTDPVNHDDVQEIIVAGLKEGCARSNDGSPAMRVRATSSTN